MVLKLLVALIVIRNSAFFDRNWNGKHQSEYITFIQIGQAYKTGTNVTAK